ncbi:MAG TPA: phage tail protein [Chitinophagaceae bacterium]|jgi:phage tail-like protein|nr:phage tail protein [Chitinophagaceae bacterium]
MSLYQTVNFHFAVHFNFEPGETNDIRFQSVSGLDSTLETETIKEGGENHFEHVIPLRRRYGPLVLKRGLIKPEQSKLTKWLKDAFDNEKIVTWPEVVIMLFGDDHKVMMKWTINNVWPRSWKVGELHAERGEILIESLELNYNRLVFSDP